MSKQVGFNTVTIMEFPMVLGNNPSCLQGVPVMMDAFSEPLEVSTIDLDLYDFMRQQRKHRRRWIVQICMRCLTLPR